VYTEGMATSEIPSLIDLLSDALRLSAADTSLRGSGLDMRGQIDAAISAAFDDPDFEFAEVALAVGLSERRIRDILAEGNETFRGAVLARRMKKARWMLLSSEYTVEEVAFLCGYRCASTFAARFREANGMSPRAWRKDYGGVARAGGTTGCFRAPAARARAARDGLLAPDTRRTRPSRGERAMDKHSRQHAERRAILRGELAKDASIAERARIWMRAE
jgi:AraC-like DNA-binding protein